MNLPLPMHALQVHLRLDVTPLPDFSYSPPDNFFAEANEGNFKIGHLSPVKDYIRQDNGLRSSTNHDAGYKPFFNLKNGLV